MTGFFSKLFGPKGGRDSAVPAVVPQPPQDRGGQSGRPGASDRYFAAMAGLQEAISRRDFEKAAELVRQSLDDIPDWVRENSAAYGSFDIHSVPALQQGGTVLALVGDDAGVARLVAMVSASTELAPWREEAAGHLKDLRLFRSIMATVTEQPGCLQTDLKDLLGEPDGRRISNLVSYLEKAGRIARVRSGKTWRLVLPGSAEAPPALPKRIAGSHRTSRTPLRVHEIDLSAVSVVPLPRSPLRWEEARTGRERAAVPEADGPFEVRDADWEIRSVSAIPPAERPDPAFRHTHPTEGGLLMIDESGKAEGLGSIPAAAMFVDRTGTPTVKKGLLHDIYRIGVHPLGRGVVALSREGVLHAYDDQLSSIIETALAEAPEIIRLRKRFGISDDQLKNHIRCVALSHDNGRYLFTGVDEACCVDRDGQGLWSLKMPTKEGWTRITGSEGAVGTSSEVQQALDLMSLAFPLTPEALKTRYRELARRWHPDVNRADPQAGSKMKALNAAAEVLTGIETDSLPEFTGVRFTQELKREAIEVEGLRVTLTMGLQVGEIHASDWIYAASFEASGGGAYLAGYSGRVVRVGEDGSPLRVYNIGSVPRRIIDTGDFLYILTDTRLYVLRDEALHALVDLFDGGDLIVAQTGFGLLEKKRLRWFSEGGRYLGSVVTSDPIRRVYDNGEGMVVETRQRRASIAGAPAWWP